MARTGDSYTVVLKDSHIKWGTYRNTETREPVPLEGYIPIPKECAVEFNILNSNGTDKRDIFGQNLFYCRSEDGFFEGVLKAQGSSDAGDIYAKQFAENDNLKGLGYWFRDIGAEVGSRVRVSWTSSDSVVISMVE
ncbi:hypothetical protein JNO48_10640 [Clostridiales bacterium]|nr:hypothetical protein JNO48_10640 [Clostridiales bacterium]